MSGWFRFRRFRTRLLFLLVGLLAVALGAVYFLVAHANRSNALTHIAENLGRGVRLYQEAVTVRIEVLAKSGSQMATDYAYRQMLLSDQVDTATARSALKNAAERIGVPVVALFNPDGDLVANTREDLTQEHCGPFRNLIKIATDANTGSNNDFASDFAYLGDRLHVMVVVPLYGPGQDILKWFGFAFPIDDNFAGKIKSLADLEVTFVSGIDEKTRHRQVLGSTLAPVLAQALAGTWLDDADGKMTTRVLDLDSEPFVTAFQKLPLLGDDPAGIVLQRSLTAELAPARELEKLLLLIVLAALSLAMLVAFALARGVSQPVQALAAHTKHVAAGDYTQRIDLQRDDELGQLSTAFNQMTAGLAERDRVRDLLGKVVSPEIATQLLQSDLKLGGEEREVTILFSDLRDFTSFSEGMQPTELLTLLNRYLDRMSAIVEKHGGVIDKYIGDAIMALFGAPVAAADSADRAIAAAREMAAALAALNVELAAEGKPPLRFGVGINTARVIAGNMGSKTRLNYTVIGDGVNLASRLEGLTKEPAYDTRIIISEATLRAARNAPAARELGEVKVKGKAQAVKIFALGAKGESQPPYHT